MEYVYVVGPGEKLPKINVEVGDIPAIVLIDAGVTCSVMRKIFREEKPISHIEFHGSN